MPDISKDPNNLKLPEELQNCLRDLVKQCEEEDSWVRKSQVKLWKKNDEFWHGIQYIFWSESKQDWVSPAETRWFQQEEGREEAEGPFYDYVINIYRAHGEAIISALTAQLPAVRFPPDDAEDEDDLITSKTYAKVGDLIQRHNNAKILALRALFYLANQGLVAAYHAPKSDKAFGEIQIPQYEPNPETGDPQIAGFRAAPKSRTIIELYGPLHFKISCFARAQQDTGYLLLNRDFHKSYLKSLFPQVADKIEADQTEMGQFERMARTPSAFGSSTDENQYLTTLRRAWIRPWLFESISKEKEDEKKQLQELFPNGCYVAFVGKVYVEARDEELDKYWTIGQSGLSQYIHSDPLLQPLIPVQEMTNVLANLTLETVEQGIPSTFADTEALNFESYSRHEARPGMVYPIHVRPGDRAGNYFYEGGRASLSKEVPGFQKQLEQAGQFVTGSFPSVFGGPSEGKSRTAAEYNMSRQMALQRLGIAWTFFNAFWCKTIEKSVKIFIETMTDDERFVVPNQVSGNSAPQANDTSYINVWIRRAEMTGKVGEVEPEGADSFPVSTPQKQELLMRLIQMNNEFLNAAIFDPENRRLIADTLAYPDLFIPGEDQRIKQARETQRMLNGEPVMPNPLVDDDSIHAGTLRAFLVSQTGIDVERTNPQGFQLCMQHLNAHVQALAMKMAPPPGGPGGPPGPGQPTPQGGPAQGAPPPGGPG